MKKKKKLVKAEFVLDNEFVNKLKARCPSRFIPFYIDSTLFDDEGDVHETFAQIKVIHNEKKGDYDTFESRAIIRYEVSVSVCRGDSNESVLSQLEKLIRGLYE